MSSGEPWLSRIWMYATRRMRHVNNEARLMSAWQRWQKSGYTGGKVPLVRNVSLLRFARERWRLMSARCALRGRSLASESCEVCGGTAFFCDGADSQDSREQRCPSPCLRAVPAARGLVSRQKNAVGRRSPLAAGTKLLMSGGTPRVAESGARITTGIDSLSC
jgi:hypothetical protein